MSAHGLSDSDFLALQESKISPEPMSGCWLWCGTISQEGYGVIKRGGLMRNAHRWLWEQWFGAAPVGLVTDHLCRVRCCVNPAHLQFVTNVENVMRGRSPMAINARKTHCPRGHVLAGENLLLSQTKSGTRRVCRSCKRRREQEMRDARSGA